MVVKWWSVGLWRVVWLYSGDMVGCEVKSEASSVCKMKVVMCIVE